MDVATYNEGFAAFQQAAASLQGEGKPLFLFKKGDWLFGQDQEEIAAGTEIALNIAEAEWGWIRWDDKKPVDRKMVLVASGQPMAARDELGHTDQSLWPTDENGNPQDPWQNTIEIPGRRLDGDTEEFVLAGSSRGFHGAVKKLFNAFGKGMRTNAGKVPVITIGVGSYDHKTYGRTKFPILDLSSWKSADELPAEVEQQELIEEQPKKGKQTKF